jgi:hypothetical protein
MTQHRHRANGMRQATGKNTLLTTCILHLLKVNRYWLSVTTGTTTSSLQF